MVISVFHLTHQIKIATGSGHSAAILPAGHCQTAVEKPLSGIYEAVWETIKNFADDVLDEAIGVVYDEPIDEPKAKAATAA